MDMNDHVTETALVGMAEEEEEAAVVAAAVLMTGRFVRSPRDHQTETKLLATKRDGDPVCRAKEASRRLSEEIDLNMPS